MQGIINLSRNGEQILSLSFEVLKKQIIELIKKFENEIENIKYNNLCTEITRDMETLAGFFYIIHKPLESEELKKTIHKIQKEYTKLHKVALQRFKDNNNKNAKYDSKVFFASLALLEIINFVLNDELMKSFGGYKKQKSLIEFGKSIYNGK